MARIFVADQVGGLILHGLMGCSSVILISACDHTPHAAAKRLPRHATILTLLRPNRARNTDNRKRIARVIGKQHP